MERPMEINEAIQEIKEMIVIGKKKNATYVGAQRVAGDKFLKALETVIEFYENWETNQEEDIRERT